MRRIEVVVGCAETRGIAGRWRAAASHLVLVDLLLDLSQIAEDGRDKLILRPARSGTRMGRSARQSGKGCSRVAET
eukprot:scaffold191331_cov30-Tisochrysis_lutea.AAC.5